MSTVLKNKLLHAMGILVIGVLFFSCGGGHPKSGPSSGTGVNMKYATLLDIREHSGYTEVTVLNPWDTLKILRRYILVPSDSALPKSLPEGTLVRTPLRNALIYSSIHCSLLRELGAADAIGGVCGREYIRDSVISGRIDSGNIADCGDNMNPDVEKIIRLNPQAILASPYQNGDSYGKAGALGIPVIECADYMETSALGRAEWVKFYGLLFGRDLEAEHMFSSTEKEYNQLKELASESKEHPKVIFGQRYGQTWDVPGSNSTTGRRIVDAGGRNPFDYFKQNGSVSLSPERVLAEAHDADVWFVNYYQDNDKTLSELKTDAGVNSQFKAFKEGKVYGCNTKKKDLYEETPFHPERLLRDMVIILHPGLLEDEETKYYDKMK